MKIICDVEVSNRLLPSQSMVGSRRSVKSTLGIGRLDGKSEDIFLLHQTTQNKTGNKYKVSGNVEGLFTRFIAEGKATIRLRTPPHDLCVRAADPIQLNCFLRLLRNGISGKSEKGDGSKQETEKFAAKSSLSDDKPNLKSRINFISPASKLLASIKRTLKITKRSDYPSVVGFPKTLEELQINGLSISRLDKQVTRLPLLRVLDLTDNRLSSLPKELSLLSNLRELRLSHNSMGDTSEKVISSSSSNAPNQPEGDRWAWIGGKLASTLTFLDLGHNKMKNIPDILCRLKGLLNLKLDHNELTELPSGLGTLKNLRILSVSNNKLLYLPGSLKKLRLEAIDISNNPPMERETQLRSLWPEHISPASVLGIPTLFEIAARKVVSVGMHPTASDVPYQVVTYLSAACFCVCGSPCFESKLKMLIPIDPRYIAYSVVRTSGATNPPTLAYLCSLRCLESVKKT